MLLIYPDPTKTPEIIHGDGIVTFLEKAPIFTNDVDKAVYAAWLLEQESRTPWKVIQEVFWEVAGVRTHTQKQWLSIGEDNVQVWQLDDHWGITVINYSQLAIVPWGTPRTETWKVRSLDVWGNENDGWDVNDVHMVGNVEIVEDSSAEMVLQVLEENAFLSTTRGLEVDFSEEDIGIKNEETGEPVLSLVKEGLEEENPRFLEIPPVDWFHVAIELVNGNVIYDAFVYAARAEAEVRADEVRRMRLDEIREVVVAHWMPDAVETDRDQQRQQRAVESQQQAVTQRMSWYIVANQPEGVQVFEDAYANEEDAVVAGEEWQRNMNFLARADGDDSDPYSFTVERRPSPIQPAAPRGAQAVAAMITEQIQQNEQIDQCSQCGGTMRMRYPGNDPENGPARFMCSQECVSPEAQAEIDREMDQQADELVQDAYRSGQWHIVFAVDAGYDPLTEMDYDARFSSRHAAVEAISDLIRTTSMYHGFPVRQIRVVPGPNYMEAAPSEDPFEPAAVQVWYLRWRNPEWTALGMEAQEFASEQAARTAAEQRTIESASRPGYWLDRRIYTAIQAPRAVTYWWVTSVSDGSRLGYVHIHAETSPDDIVRNLLAAGFVSDWNAYAVNDGETILIFAEGNDDVPRLRLRPNPDPNLP